MIATQIIGIVAMYVFTYFQTWYFYRLARKIINTEPISGIKPVFILLLSVVPSLVTGVYSMMLFIRTMYHLSPALKLHPDPILGITVIIGISHFLISILKITTLVKNIKEWKKS